MVPSDQGYSAWRSSKRPGISEPAMRSEITGRVVTGTALDGGAKGLGLDA